MKYIAPLHKLFGFKLFLTIIVAGIFFDSCVPPSDLDTRIVNISYRDTAWQRIYNLQVDLEPGVGADFADDTYQDPLVSLQISRDGGHTWSEESFCQIGRYGNYKTRAQWSRLGSGRDFVFKISIASPVRRCFLGIYADIRQ